MAMFAHDQLVECGLEVNVVKALIARQDSLAWLKRLQPVSIGLLLV